MLIKKVLFLIVITLCIATTFNCPLSQNGIDSAGITQDQNNVIPDKIPDSEKTEIQVSAGWNFLSVPRMQANYNVSKVFPGNTGVKRWDTGTQKNIDITKLQTGDTTNGQGYWVQFNAPATIAIKGHAKTCLTISAKGPGWVLVGSRTVPVLISTLILSDGAKVFGDAFRFNPASSNYEITSVINPGSAAWLYVDKACTITIPDQTMISLSSGWNFISVPRIQSDLNVNSVFPGNSGVMKWDIVNQMNSSTLTVSGDPSDGQGYWVRYDNSAVIAILGVPKSTVKITADTSGWVLIGSRTTQVQISALVLTNNAKIIGDAFWYNLAASGYDITNVIDPGSAAWLYVDNPCEITIP